MGRKKFEKEDTIITTALDDSGELVDSDSIKKLFILFAISTRSVTVHEEKKQKLNAVEKESLDMVASRIMERNGEYFDQEVNKLDKWAEDVKNNLEIELKELDKEIKYRKTEAKKILNLEEKVKAHRKIKEMEKKRNTMRLNLYQTQDEIDNKKEQLIGKGEARLKQKIEQTELFTIRWKGI